MINGLDSRYQKLFEKIVRTRYPADATSMLADLDRRYEVIARDVSFAASSSNPIDKRLPYTACCLALIKTMHSRGFDYQAIRMTCLEVTYELVRPKNRFNAWIRRLPPKLFGTWLADAFVKVMNRRVGVKGHPDGFRAQVVSDRKLTYGLGYGVDILECGICKLYQKHDAGEFVSILCEVDKVTSGLAGLELVRNGTIAAGATHCDFRFKKK
jgi:hypothetical protein